MKRLQAYKFLIEPNGAQIRQMHQFAGNSRKVWNLALAQQQANYALGEKFTSVFGMNNWLPSFKKEFPFLRESPAQTLQQVMADLGRAYQGFFDKRSDHPKFKKKGKARLSFRFPDAKQFTIDEANKRIKLPKLDWIRYRKSRAILGDIKNITISCVANKWYASIQTMLEVEKPIHPSTSIVGIDVGINLFATLSDGTMIKPANCLRKNSTKLAKYQRRLSRQKKFGKNWHKQKHKITRLHQKIAHSRHDFLHKTSSHICKNHAMIVLEDLKIKNMSATATGTLESPGKNIAAKSGLNKSILDQGWGEFRRQLEYKQSWLGGDVIVINPKNTSRTCPACHHISALNRPTQAEFVCVECGHSEHADVNAAINILRAGHARLACQVNDAVISPATGTHRSDSIRC